MQISDQLDFIYAAGETRRFHTWPVLRSQNVANHSWHVAMLGWLLYGQSEPGITPMFLMALLSHDMAECRLGDIPSPAKRQMDSLLELADKQSSFRQQWGAAEQEILSGYGLDWENFLTIEELRRFKLVDAIEGAAYCVTERSMGNRLIKPCYDNFCKYISELLEDVAEDVPLGEQPKTVHEREWEVFLYIKSKWDAVDER